MKVIVGITGASGSIYAYSLICLLEKYNVDVSVIFTETGEKVMEYECGISKEEMKKHAHVFENNNLFSKAASGSSKYDAMVIIPCSMNTLSSISNGIGDTLLTRAASVILKENRKLIVVARETPLNIIQLENMCRLAKAGACIMPASPSFYSHPKEIWELVNGIVVRIMDQLNIEVEYEKRWKGDD